MQYVPSVRGLIQRVRRAGVIVDGEVVGRIGPGLLVLVGVTHGDDDAVAEKLGDKIWNIRVFDDLDGKMNRSVADGSGEVWVVSQFTLYGDTRRGRRPGYSAAAPPELAEPLVERLVARLRSHGATVECGVFGAHMEVDLVNDGPVTLLLEVPSPG